MTPWTVARQAPLSMGFSRQEYWSGLPFSSPGELPNPGIKPTPPALQVDSLPLAHQVSQLAQVVRNPPANAIHGSPSKETAHIKADKRVCDTISPETPLLVQMPTVGRDVKTQSFSPRSQGFQSCIRDSPAFKTCIAKTLKARGAHTPETYSL